MSSIKNSQMELFLIALKHVLSDRSLTQKDLAEMTGSHQAVISRWFNGGRNPGVQTQTRIAAALGYDLVDFLSLGRTLAGGEAPQSEAAPAWLNPFHARLKALSKPQRLKLLSMIEGFLQAHDK